MNGIEEDLRQVAHSRSERYEPSTDLTGRIHARVRHHRRQRQLRAGAAGAGLVAAVVLAVALVPNLGKDHDSVEISDDGRTTTSATDEPTTTSSPTTSTTSAGPGTSATTVTTAGTSTTTSDPSGGSEDEAAGPLVGPDTPLTREGIGPIVAGMTLREAEQAAGVTITIYAGGAGSCRRASIEGGAGDLLAEVTGGAGADPMDSVLRSVSVAVEGSTEEGVAIGDPIARLDEVYGPPTRTVAEWDGPGSELRVYQSGNYAYWALVNTTEIAVLGSGDAAWAGEGAPGSCA